MEFSEFNKYLGETICYYQLIENDLKIIYGYMHKGKPEDNITKIKNCTMGQVISKLQILDNSDGESYFTANDYKYLKQITKKKSLVPRDFFVFCIQQEFYSIAWL